MQNNKTLTVSINTNIGPRKPISKEWANKVRAHRKTQQTTNKTSKNEFR